MSVASPTVRLVFVLLAATSSAVAGFEVGRFTASDSASEAAVTRFTTASVKVGPLDEHVVLQGEIKAQGRFAVAAPDVPGSLPVVTSSAASVGTVVAAGDVLFEVAGRPVFLLSGDLPQYRVWHLDDAGPDIVQLEEALRDLDIDISPDGVFDLETTAALRELYRSSEHDFDGESPPLGEIVFGESSSLTVIASNYDRGDIAAGIVVELARDQGTIEVVAPEEVALAVLSQPSAVSAEVSSTAFTGSIEAQLNAESLTHSASLSPSEGFRVLRFDLADVPRRAAEFDSIAATVRFSVRRATAEQLVVPLSAIEDGFDASQLVRVQDSDTTAREVEVLILAVVGNDVVVQARLDGALSLGDRVILIQ